MNLYLISFILSFMVSYVASLTSSMSDALYYDYTGKMTAIYGKAILTAIVVCLVILAIVTIAEWRIFKKAGQPGWAALIPFYNDYINYKIFWGNGFLFLFLLVLSVLCRLLKRKNRILLTQRRSLQSRKIKQMMQEYRRNDKKALNHFMVGSVSPSCNLLF